MPSVNTTRMVSANTEDSERTVMLMKCVNKIGVKIIVAPKDTQKNVESSTHVMAVSSKIVVLTNIQRRCTSQTKVKFKGLLQKSQ